MYAVWVPYACIVAFHLRMHEVTAGCSSRAPHKYCHTGWVFRAVGTAYSEGTISEKM